MSDSVPAQCSLKILHKAGGAIKEFEAYLSRDNKGGAHLRHMTPVLGPEVKPHDFLVLRTVDGDSYEANIVMSKSLGGQALASWSGSDAAMVFDGEQVQLYFTDYDGQLRDLNEEIDRTSSQNVQLSDHQKSAEPQQNVHQHPLVTGVPPEWASEWGHDQYGPWCSLQVEDARQLLRWIPAGQFEMRTAEEFKGLFDEDEPRNWATLTRGFWMFETLCSHKLFNAVIKEERQAAASHPGSVVHVAYLTAQDFCKKLGEMLACGAVALPTDAQWEFACRAGRQDGPHFDREPESATESNPWGLRDMMTGVGEFCQDGPREGSEEAVVDPVGDHEDVIVRGLAKDLSVPLLHHGQRTIDEESSLSLTDETHPSFREIVEPNVPLANVGFRCVIAEDIWIPTAFAQPTSIEQNAEASTEQPNDLDETATVELDDTPLWSLMREMESQLRRYYSELNESVPGLESRWRLNTGHPLCDGGRKVVHAIPDAIPDRNKSPNFAGRGGRLWYMLLRTSRRAQFEVARPYLIAAARDLAVWLRDQYPNEFPHTFVVGDIPLSLRLANLKTFLALKDLSPSQRLGTGTGWFAEQHPLLNAAVKVLVAIPDVTTAKDGTPNFPDIGGRLWLQLRNSLASNADNSKQAKQRSSFARHFSDWVSLRYGTDSLEAVGLAVTPTAETPQASIVEAPQRTERQFDVSLSYNIQDKEAIEQIVEGLKNCGLTVFHDSEQTSSGDDWNTVLEKANRICCCCIICVSKNGVGRWERAEIDTYMHELPEPERTEFHERTIPVLLPGAPDPGDTRASWNSHLWLDLRHGLGKAEWDLLESVIRKKISADRFYF
ncbi:MAG TPA: SUMF1/EgtB/PvdO family nonheme iron enzyme [Planctomycetaceae bacterium]|nr:SUMF1/EgtB/PvdO family nonheme iron enzyme [Planctomycetaceae bacterium]